MSEADDSFASPVGAIGRITVPIPPDGFGEVLVTVRGGSEAYAAWADKPIGKHIRVMVTESISARSVIVEPLPS
jgi:hypothetical protein